MRSHYLFLFFILSSFHSLYLSPHCLSISSFFLHKPPLHHRSNKPNRRPFSPSPISQAADPFLHRRSHKLSRHKPFSPSPISQAQLPQTLLSIADLTSPATTNPSMLLCTHSVSIKKDQAMLLAAKSSNQYQLGLDSSMKTVKLCPLAQVSSVGTKTNRVSGMGFGLAILIFMGFCFVVLHWF